MSEAVGGSVPVTGDDRTAGEVWAAEVFALGGPPAAAAAGRDLDARYAEPHRRYHVGAHAAAVVRDATRLCDELGVSGRERSAVRLAACAHDVVYAARPGEDERASAAWAAAALEDVDAGVRDRVVGLVLATADHAVPAGDAAATALLDADLAILGADAGTYDAYVTAVRFEYRKVSDEDWRTGRAAVLRSFVERPALYVSSAARARWEAAARANIARELAGLSEPAGLA